MKDMFEQWRIYLELRRAGEGGFDCPAEFSSSVLASLGGAFPISANVEPRWTLVYKSNMAVLLQAGNFLRTYHSCGH